MTAPALLAISHGTADLAGQAAISALVRAVAGRLPEVAVTLGHVDVQQPDVGAALAAVPGDQTVVLVPLLLSAGYHVHVDLVKETADRDRLVITPALGPDRRLIDVLADRLTELSPAPDAAVVLAVAGSSDERANDDCRITARMLSEHISKPVDVGFLAAAEPRLDEAVARAGENANPVVVATYLLAPGFFHDLAVEKAHPAPVARPLLDGADPARGLVDLVVDRYRHAATAL